MLYTGNSIEILKTLSNDYIDLIITSPPYYGLRNYGVDGQIGLEKTPQDYINNLMNVFTECKRVLKKTGSLWVNIGDSYGGTGSKGEWRDPKYKEGRNGQVVSLTAKLSPKSLLGIPERFVISMTDAGWIRRNTIIWYKPNCMPSSAKDRFTNDFEYFYFFTKSQKYYFETQYEPHVSKPSNNKRNVGTKNLIETKGQIAHSFHRPDNQYKYSLDGRLKRTVWQISTQPLKEAHFAVFPEKLIETPIKACCPPNGIVLDPFCGSGTTCLVAKKLGRQYIGIDLNEEYIKIAEKRLKNILF